MATINQIRAGLAAYYDTEIRQTLPGMKGIVYGAAVGLALAKPEKLLAKVLPAAQMLGIVEDDGQIDVDTLAREIKKQMASAGGEMRFEIGLNPLNVADVDIFRFTVNDVDRLLDHIKRQ